MSSSKRDFSQFSAEELAAIKAGSKRAKTSENVTQKVYDQSKGDTFSFRAFVSDVRPYEKNVPLTLKSAKMTLIPMFEKDLEFPPAVKSIRVEHVPVDPSAPNGATRAEVVFKIVPNDLSRNAYDVEWAPLRSMLKRIEILRVLDEHLSGKVENTLAAPTTAAAAAPANALQITAAPASPNASSDVEMQKNGHVAANQAQEVKFGDKTLPEATAAVAGALVAVCGGAGALVASPSAAVAVAPVQSLFQAGDLEALQVLFDAKSWLELREVCTELLARIEKSAAAATPKTLLQSLALLPYATLRVSGPVVQFPEIEVLNWDKRRVMKTVVKHVDDKFGVDKLEPFYEQRLRNGLPTRLKAPKETCQNAADVLKMTFGDMVEFHHMNFRAYVWNMTWNGKGKKPDGPAPYPFRPSISLAASKLIPHRMNPITLFHAFEALHNAAPGALAHPILRTIWMDVYQLSKQKHESAADAEHEGGGDDELLGSIADIVRITQQEESERFRYRAGMVSQTEKYVETTDGEKMLSTFDSKANQKLIALKTIATITTWWPTNAQVRTFHPEQSFAYTATLILRAFQEHLFPWWPVRSSLAHINLMPTFLHDMRAYFIFNRDVDSAFAYEETRDHCDSFRAPFTSNKQRMERVQTMENGWLKRIAIDPVAQARRVGVPASAAEVRWFFKKYASKATRVRMGDSQPGAVNLSSTFVAVNELSESDFDVVLNSAPGTWQFYIVSAGWVPNAAYLDVFNALHENGAVASGTQTLASALFADAFVPGESEVPESEDDFIEPHALVKGATKLSKIPIGDPCYVFAVQARKYVNESQAEVVHALRQMLGYSEFDTDSTVETICEDVAKRAAAADAQLLPRLEQIAHDEEEDGFNDADMVAAAAAAEAQAASTRA